MDGTLDVTLHWEPHVGFGFNFNDGFYVVIGDPQNPDQADLDVGLTVSLSDNATLTGELGFLQLQATNDYDLRTGNDDAYGFQGTARDRRFRGSTCRTAPIRPTPTSASPTSAT